MDYSVNNKFCNIANFHIYTATRIRVYITFFLPRKPIYMYYNSARQYCFNMYYGLLYTVLLIIVHIYSNRPSLTTLGYYISTSLLWSLCFYIDAGCWCGNWYTRLCIYIACKLDVYYVLYTPFNIQYPNTVF